MPELLDSSHRMQFLASLDPVTQDSLVKLKLSRKIIHFEPAEFSVPNLQVRLLLSAR